MGRRARGVGRNAGVASMCTQNDVLSKKPLNRLVEVSHEPIPHSGTLGKRNTGSERGSSWPRRNSGLERLF